MLLLLLYVRSCEKVRQCCLKTPCLAAGPLHAEMAESFSDTLLLVSGSPPPSIAVQILCPVVCVVCVVLPDNAVS